MEIQLNSEYLKQIFSNIPINKNKQIQADFFQVFKELLNEKKYLKQFLKDLDAYDSVTYSHSIKVAMQTFYILKETNCYTPEEIKDWTSAALVHDVGKLDVPLHILNSKINYRKHPEIRDKELPILMHHSLNGKNKAKEYGFNRIEMIAVMCHHIKADSIENNFENAISSKLQWKEYYTKESLEQLLRTTLGELSIKEQQSIEIISFVDQVEALRANDRPYKEQREWDITYKYDEDKNLIFNDDGSPQTEDGIIQLINRSVNCHELNQDFLNIVKNHKYQKTFDALQKNIVAKTRTYLKNITKDLPFKMSDYKIQEIKNNPSVGFQFLKSGDPKNYIFETSNETLLKVPRKHELKGYKFDINQELENIYKNDPEIELE